MRIGGLQEFTLIDYPDKVACIIFTQGCNFRCGYCHNPQLVYPEQFCQVIPEEKVFDFLRGRQKYLQGVVITGGEPTLQGDLITFIAKIKALGYLVKLDTNGSYPRILRELISLGLVDFIAMDVKTSLGRYEAVIRKKIDVNTIQESIDVIINSGVSHEFRTTVVKPFCLEEDILKIRQIIEGCQRYRLQDVQ